MTTRRNYAYITLIALGFLLTITRIDVVAFDMATIELETEPFDPLTPDEITRTAEIIKDSPTWNGEHPVFNTISLHEPPKADLIPFYYKGVNPPKTAFTRKSFSILWSRHTGRVIEAVVDLDGGTLESLKAMPVGTTIPTLSPEDTKDIIDATKLAAMVTEKCSGFGITDMDLVYPVPWPHRKNKHDQIYKGQWLWNVYLYTQNFPGDNAYAHPLPFLVIVDGIGPRVVAIQDLPTDELFDMGRNQSGNIVPKKEANYDPNFRSKDFLRKNDKPIQVTSPQGRSYEVKGHEVEWQGFRFRLGFNPREGLTLHTITYQESSESTVRPIAYRASLSESGVFYGDPRPPYHEKYGFDESQIGMGWTNSLSATEDCIGDVHFLNATVNDNNGNPVIIPNSICIYEDDAGVLWRHTDSQTKRKVGVRSHRLNLMTIITTGNYDLIVTWSFHQDASIRFNAALTGLLSTNLMAVGATPGGFGSTVFPQINGQFHQHFFSVRIDADVDGVDNTVVMRDVVSLKQSPGSRKNPYGNGFRVKETPLRTQEEGATDSNPQSARVWVVTNPNEIHPYTKGPVGWKLTPSNDPAVLLHPDSPILNPKLRFLCHNIWVTQYKDDQLFASGKYAEDTGLPEWVEDDPKASVENTDIVLWHVFSPVHIPRVEDFPCMPLEERSVWFKPFNFFRENPGLNVPPVQPYKDEF